MFALELSEGLNIKCNRIGYDTEGLRLQIFDTLPFRFHIELQLSKKDCENLIELLQKSYENEKGKDWR